MSTNPSSPLGAATISVMPTLSMEHALALEGVSKSFDQTTVVQDVSFEVPAGSLTVLLGPSGCGKSTLLRLIAGFETPDLGVITIGQKTIHKLPPARRNISMVFQSYALFPHLSVADNILFGLQVRKVSKDQQAERLGRVADIMGLAKLLQRKPSQLSGGQQQRVALARAIVSERPICLMDEPLSNLDAKLRHEMRREIRSLQQKLGLTMVYVTHDQVEAITMADQIVLMRDGQIEQVAAPDDLYQHPATRFCAEFIGTPAMNIISADDLNVALVPSGRQIKARDSVVGIRPEEIFISEPGSGVSAKLIATEYLGADRLLTCVIGNSEIVVRAPAGALIEESETIFLKWSAASEHYFDAETGQRLPTSSTPQITLATGG